MDRKKQFGKVAVLFGGLSRERAVSLKSGEAVLKALLDAGVDAHGVDVGSDIVSVLQNGQFDRAFNVVHGMGGEDGRLQALLEFLEIPYCGSGVAASALAMDKVRSKWIWQANGLPTPHFVLLKNESELDAALSSFHLPVAVKPVHDGSSLAVTKVKQLSELLPAYKKALATGDEVMMEQWIIGDEFSVPVIEGMALPSIKIVPAREFYDYEAKYIEKTTQYICPSGLSQEKEQEIRALALCAFELLGGKGWGRVDIMQDTTGGFWVLETNTLPGMTAMSLVPKSARVLGMEFPELAVKILETSL